MFRRSGEDTRINEFVRCWDGNIYGPFLGEVEGSRTHVLRWARICRLQGLFIEHGVKIPWCMCRGNGDIPGPICMGVARYMGLFLVRVEVIQGPKISSGW